MYVYKVIQLGVTRRTRPWFRRRGEAEGCLSLSACSADPAGSVLDRGIYNLPTTCSIRSCPTLV